MLAHGPLLSLAVLAVLSLPAYSLEFNEKNLLGWIRSSSPHLEAIEAKEKSVQLRQSQAQSQYEARANAIYQYSKSSEEGLASFMPVISPEKYYSVGVSKALPIGATLGLEGFGSQINTEDGLIDNATRSGVRLNVELDLLKNLFGRFDRSLLASRDFASQRARIESGLEKNAFELEVRKLYWTLLANELSLGLSNDLVETAKQQVGDARRRAQSGAADQGDVARNEAQLQSRLSSVFSFQYQKEELIAQLKTWVPALKNENIEIPKVDVQPLIRQVMACVSDIASHPELDPKQTTYTEALKLLKKEYAAEQVQAKTVGDWDLKLQGKVQYSGVDQNFSDAYTDLSKEQRSGYTVGVVLSVPLEGTAAKAEQRQKAYVEKKYSSEISQLELSISETHKKMVNTLVMLEKAAEAQKKNVGNLKTSYFTTKKKYNQARISITELMYEQDNLFRSELQSIQTNLAVLHALYDFFKVFNQHPCPLNQI